MANSTDPFHAYAQGLIMLGHDRHWIRRNEPGLRARFAADPQPFPPVAPPEPRQRDRYEEL